MEPTDRGSVYVRRRFEHREAKLRIIAHVSGAANNRLDWVNEFFCSLNVAWIAVAFELWRPQSVIYQIGGWQARHRFWHRISGEPYVVLDQVFWSVILAIAIFLILRSLASIWALGLPFRAVSGTIAISGFPLVVLLHWPLSTIYSIRLVQWRFPRFIVSLAVIEVAVSIFCITLYLFRKWRLSSVPNFILLVAHFGLWAWATGS